MNATRPLCASAVTPISAINISLIVENLVMDITILVEAFMFVHLSNLTI